eukprot:g15995.t1
MPVETEIRIYEPNEDQKNQADVEDDQDVLDQEVVNVGGSGNGKKSTYTLDDGMSRHNCFLNTLMSANSPEERRLRHQMNFYQSNSSKSKSKSQSKTALADEGAGEASEPQHQHADVNLQELEGDEALSSLFLNNAVATTITTATAASATTPSTSANTSSCSSSKSSMSLQQQVAGAGAPSAGKGPALVKKLMVRASNAGTAVEAPACSSELQVWVSEVCFGFCDHDSWMVLALNLM